MPRTRHADRILLYLSLVALLLPAACAQRSIVNFEGARDYPADQTQADTLDIQVFRDGTRVQLTNTSARVLPAGTLWLNQWYFREVPELRPGESLALSLRAFVDRYGEPFRAGGFFATRDPDFVVLAQWQAPGELLGLVVVENRFD